MPNRFRVIPEVHLFLRNDDRLLLLRRCNTDYENGNYSVIAGGVEADEEVSRRRSGKRARRSASTSAPRTSTWWA